MIKSLKVSDKAVRRFKTHKLWSYNNVTDVDGILLEQENLEGTLSLHIDERTILATEQDVESTKLKVSRGKRFESHDTFYPVGHSMHDPEHECTNQDGSYQRVVYSSIKHLFYNEYGVSSSFANTNLNYKNPLMVFGSETGNYMTNTKSENKILNINDKFQYERRVINDDIKVIQFDTNQMGDKIKPGELRMRDYSSPYGVIEIVDDGATNLLISTSSFNEIKEVSGGGVSDVKTISKNNSMFNFNDLTFGYKISSAGKYFLTGQPVMTDAPTELNSGIATLYTLDEDTGDFKILRNFYNPFTQNGLSSEINNDNTGFLVTELGGLLASEDYSINDNFGNAVELKHNCCVIGSSKSHIRGVCSKLGSTGHIFVYDKNKGGSDHWGLVNIIEGEPGTEFGSSVSIKGEFMAVGAPGYNNSEGAIYLFKKSIRTETHPWKRITDSHDDFEWSSSDGVYVGKPTGGKLRENNKWTTRWNVTSLVPNADKLTHFYRDSSEILNNICTAAGLLQYSVSEDKSVNDQEHGITTSGWKLTGVLSTPPGNSTESALPYPVDVYDSVDNLLGHITYTGKPTISSLYFSFGDGNSQCISGIIENNLCRLTGGLLLNQCTEPGFTEYRVSNSESINDQDAGVTSSTWIKPGILSISSSDMSNSVSPYPVDVYDSTNTLIGHITYSGTPKSMNLYFKTSDMDESCVYGKIEGNVCVLPVELVMSGNAMGKQVSADLNDYRVSPDVFISDNQNGVVSSKWMYNGVLSIPYADASTTSTPYSIDIYDVDDVFVGHITYTGFPVSSNIYFTDELGDNFFGVIVDARCNLMHVGIPDIKPPRELPECTESGFNIYDIASDVIVDDSENGIKSSTWAYTGTISTAPADTKYGTQTYTVDVYDYRNILLGTLTYFGNPSSKNIYFKRESSSGCESGVIVDNVCKLTPFDIISDTSHQELPCDSINAEEIETFDGEPIATEGSVSGFPPHRYAEYDNGDMSPEHSIGNVTWDLVEVITIPESHRLGEEVKLTSDCIYSSAPNSRIQYCSVLRKLSEPTECGVGWKHTHNITKTGIYNFDTDPVGYGDGFTDISFYITESNVVLQTKLDSIFNADSGFVYRVDVPLNEPSSFNNELVLHGGTYLEKTEFILTLSNGLHDIYLARINERGEIVGRQSRVNLSINPIPHNIPNRENNVKYPYEYNFDISGAFGTSLDANEHYLVIGDSHDRDFVDPSNPDVEISAGAVYVFSTKEGDVSFLKKTYSDIHEEFSYTSEYGRSVSLKGSDFLVGAPCSDTSEISILDGGENVGVKDFKRGTRKLSDTTYTSEQIVYTDVECSYVGGDMPDVVVKIPVNIASIDLDLISEFTISADFIETSKSSLYTISIPDTYNNYEVSPNMAISDNIYGITSSVWTKSGIVWTSPPTTSTSVPTPIDIYDADDNFIGHLTYTGTPSSNQIYFIEGGVPYTGEIINSKCKLSLYTKNLGAVTRGVYRDLTKFENGNLCFYVDVASNTYTQSNSSWKEDSVEFIYYEQRNAEEGSVYYYRIGESDVEQKAMVKTNKYPYKVRHQFGMSVSLSSDYIYVGSPVMGNFTVNELEAFEGSDLGLFEQCSTIYSSYGDIAWGKLSNMDIDISGKILAYDVASIRDDERVYVGNIFYKNGIAVITNSSDYFSNVFMGSNDRGFDISYRGTHEIYENEILCSVAPGEFNASTNPTSVSYDDIDYDVNNDIKFDITDLSYIYRYMMGSLVDIRISSTETYTVGIETLETICREFGIPYPSHMDIQYKDTTPVEISFGLLDIRRVSNGTLGNRLRYTDPIEPGETLQLRDGTIYTVRAVQSIESIAKFTGATSTAIYGANSGVSTSTLYLGQELIIPAGGDITPGIKFEEGHNTNWPNDDLVLTESEDLILINVLLRSTENSVNINEYNKILKRLEALEAQGLLDIDGDGMMTDIDAKLLVRYFVGRTGKDLTDGLINTFTMGQTDQTRTSAYQILNFLNERTGKNRGTEILQDFVDYKENDAKDRLGSYLAPYATTIGLYSGLDLVMVAKLSKPVKIVPNYPINFLVKYDT